MSKDTATGTNSTHTDPTRSPAAEVKADQHVRAVAILVAIGGVLILVIAAVAVWRSSADAGTTIGVSGPSDDGWRGVLLDDPAPRPDFTLTDTDGQPFDFQAETEGRLTLLFFGYTNCPDICPIQMGVLAGALETLATPEPTVVFVGVDSERDTPEALRAFLDQFNTRFIGLHGNPDEIARAEQAAPNVAPSARFVEPDADADDDYLVGHSSPVIAYTPDDQAHVVYPAGVRREDWIADLPRLLDEFGTAGKQR